MKQKWIHWGVWSLFHLLLISQTFAQPQKIIQLLEKKGYPPGTIRIEDNLYMDEVEITNLDWKEYLFFLKQDSTQEVWESMIPDTTIFNKGNKKIKSLHINPSERFVYYKTYYDSPIHQMYPVIGVSHKQAVAYCQWRSDLINQNLQVMAGKKRSWQKALGSKQLELLYRLPTAEEWERGALGELDSLEFPLGYPEEQLELLRFKENPLKDGHFVHEGIPFLEQVYENSPPNSLGLYGMMGNVAEMTDEKGIAKGGAYVHSRFRAQVSDIFPYQSPNHWLGFRCVCEWELEGEDNEAEQLYLEEGEMISGEDTFNEIAPSGKGKKNKKVKKKRKKKQKVMKE